MLKKVMSMVCAAVMVVGMAVPVAASPTSTVTVGPTSNPIKISVSDGSSGTLEVQPNLTTEQKSYVSAVNDVLDSNKAEDIQKSLNGSGIEVSDTTADVIANGDVTTLETPVEVKQNGDDPVILTDLEKFSYVLMLVDNEKGEKELISVKVNSDGTATVGSGLIVGFVTENTSNN